MEEKKSPKANLENKKLMFMQIGMIISLLIAWLAFEHKSYDKRQIDESLLNREVVLDEEMVEITKQEEQKPQPVEQPQQTTQLEIVEDDVETEDLNINAEVEQNEVIEEYVAPEVVEEEVVEQEIFQIVEEMPAFPGGEAKLMEYVGKNIKYPQIARETGIQGRVFIGFVVEPDGSVSNGNGNPASSVVRPCVCLIRFLCSSSCSKQLEKGEMKNPARCVGFFY